MTELHINHMVMPDGRTSVIATLFPGDPESESNWHESSQDKPLEALIAATAGQAKAYAQANRITITKTITTKDD